MRKRNPRRATPEELRVCSVLKEKGTREELAHLAARGEWSNVPAYNASREQIADHLGKSVSPESDASFFDSRRFSEAIVLLKSRPVLLVKNGIFDEAPLAGLEQRLKKHRAALATPIRSVGRLELIDHDSMDWCGTGWRIEDDLIVTNRHVASLFAERQGSLFRFRLNQAGKQVRTRVDFREEYRQPESDEHVIARVLWIAPDVSEAPDMAILQVVKGDLLPPPLSIDGGEVVGLHFGGQFRKTNYAVKASVIRSLLARRAWVPVAGAELKRGAPRFQEKQRSVADLAERKGFDEAFLGPKATLPKPGKSHQVLPVGKGTRLDYLHFSVVMSASRRLPILTAVNIDGALKRSLKRKDSWGFDPRIEAAAQVGHKDFYGPASFDKGHMVRREDPGWGDSDAIARQAEDDTFVYTNAVPQVAQLNQRSWLSLEDYVLQNARSEGFRISVFTGPVFRDDDPLYQGVQVPLEFWKVVAMIDADSGELGVSAYLLGQEGMMPSEGFRYGAFKTYQVPLAKVEASADLRFSSALRKADVLAGTPLEEALESGRFIEIDGPDDLLLSRPGPAGKGR
ncbi:DNA/RNA non-specific endonuclease [Pseudomonas aeruginosa]|uniref:DNA/RNA non-specific endonuclease n=1 Tax=Pseudomonas aeruginosa TaxID=287 RepID=UPI0034E0753F